MAGRDNACWPNQQTLAKRLHRSERSVRRYLAELIEAGFLQSSQRAFNVSNRYVLLLPGERPTMSADRPKMSGPDRTPVSADRPNLANDRTLVSADRPNLANDRPKMSSYSAAAAANSLENSSSSNSGGQSDAETVAGLVQLGFPEDLAWEYCARDAGLVRAALPHFRERLAHAEERPFRTTPIAYMRGLLNKPHNYGFEKRAGQWLPPPKEGKAGRKEASQVKQQAALDKQLSDRKQNAIEDRLNATWMAKWEQVWDGLAEIERQEIRALVRKRSPLFASKDDRAYTFMSQCLAELERRRGGRKPET